MSKIFDNIETKVEEGLHAIPESADPAGLLKVGVRRKEVPLFEVQENLFDDVDEAR